MTITQKITVCQLQREGFVINHESEKVCMVRGNDFRLINQDGSMQRAKGAKK